MIGITNHNLIYGGIIMLLTTSAAAALVMAATMAKSINLNDSVFYTAYGKTYYFDKFHSGITEITEYADTTRGYTMVFNGSTRYEFNWDHKEMYAEMYTAYTNEVIRDDGTSVETIKVETISGDIIH